MEVDAMMSNLVGLYQKVLELSPYLPQELGTLAKSLDEGGMLADLIASSLNISRNEKQITDIHTRQSGHSACRL